MKNHTQTARFVGALFLLCNFTFLLGAVGFIEPVLSDPDYLNLVYTERNQVALGVLLELMNGVAYIGITVLMYAILKSRFESIALAYVGFRMIEFVMQVLADMSPLSLLSLGEDYVTAGAADTITYELAGSMLLADRTWAFEMIAITFALGALCFYVMLYQSRLIPRFISIWGFIGASVVLAYTVFDLLGVTIPDLGLLMLLNELFLGGWLIAKGFNTAAIDDLQQTNTINHSVNTAVELAFESSPANTPLNNTFGAGH